MELEGERDAAKAEVARLRGTAISRLSAEELKQLKSAHEEGKRRVGRELERSLRSIASGRRGRPCLPQSGRARRTTARAVCAAIPGRLELSKPNIGAVRAPAAEERVQGSSVCEHQPRRSHQSPETGQEASSTHLLR